MGFSATRVLKRFMHYGPLLASFIIVLVTIMTIWSVLASTPINSYRLPSGRATWEHHPTMGTFANLTIFLIFSVLTAWNFLACMMHGPGFVRSEWRPETEEEEERLQWCQECEAFKCPRSHHCRKCRRCVKKMDHHCPWINSCVGHKNHAHFLRFLFYASVGCFYGGANLAVTIFRIVFHGNKNFILSYYFSSVPKFITLVFSCGIAFGVALAVGFLLIMQLRDIAKNMTSIESWIVKKAEWRNKMEGKTFAYPYDLGSKWNNLTQVINLTNFAAGDGYTWPVVPGTDQYTFTEEQRQQKLLKRSRTVEHVVVVPYSGSFCSGLTLRNPCLLLICNGLDEQYLPIEIGDTVMVSRYRKRWLYGSVTRKCPGRHGDMVDKDIGGWFPRKCAMEPAGESAKKTK